MRRKRGVAALASIGALAALMTFAWGGGTAGADVIHPSLTVAAHPSIDCRWSVDKSATFHGSPVTHLTLSIGEAASVDYRIVVTKTCVNHVHGTVTGDGSPSSVDVTAGDTSGSCAPIVSNGDHFSCDYDLHPSTSADGTVNATAHYGDGSTATGSTPYSFVGAPVTNDSVMVVDSFAGQLGPDHLFTSAVFTYSREIVFHECGHFTVDNRVDVFDSISLANDTYSIAVDVPCHGQGCTLTQGYWKTHSKYGPAAKPDATWNLLPGGLGPDTTFFLSGQTWYQVFWTSPSGGNVYYQLAHQYMAARLNILNGASSTSAVDVAIAGATAFFSTYTPAQAGALAKDSTARKNALAWAGTLGSYNEGTIGPGHCDE